MEKKIVKCPQCGSNYYEKEGCFVCRENKKKAKSKISKYMPLGNLHDYLIMYYTMKDEIEKYKGRNLDADVVINHLKSLRKNYQQGYITKETFEKHQHEYLNGLFKLKDFKARLFYSDPKRKTKENPALDFLIYAIMWDLSLVSKFKRIKCAFLVSEFLEEEHVASLLPDAVEKQYERLNKNPLYIQQAVSSFCKFFPLSEDNRMGYIALLLHALGIQENPKWPKYKGPTLLNFQPTKSDQ